MKKLISVLFLSLVFCLSGKSQVVVSDPTNLAVNTAIHTLTQTSQQIERFMAQAEKLKLAVEIFDQIQTVAEIMGYIDELACLTSDLQFNLNFANNFSCITALNFRAINMRLQYSTDIIVKVFLTKNLMTMTNGDRLRSLNDILEGLRQTVEDISKLNSNMRMYAKKRIMNKYIKQRMAASAFHTNRYDKRK